MPFTGEAQPNPLSGNAGQLPDELSARLRQIPGVRVVSSSEILTRGLVDVSPGRLKRGPVAAVDQLAVFPSSTRAAADVLRLASRHGVSVAIRARGSNVVAAIDASADILLGTDDLAEVVEFDEASQLISVGAGMLGSTVESLLNESGLTTGIYPQSLDISSVGGWVNTRATGTASARFGGIEHSVKGIVCVTAAGDVVRIGPRIRPAGGLDSIALLLGAEGSLALLTEVTLAARRLMPERRICSSFATFADGLGAQRELVQRRIPVDVLRLYNEAETREIGARSDGSEAICLLLATTSGTEGLIDGQALALERVITETGGRLLDSAAADGWYERRYRAAGVMEHANARPGEMYDTIEVSVPWTGAAALANEIEHQLGALSQPLFMHSSHTYETGTSLYTMLYLNAGDDDAVIEQWARCWSMAEAAVAQHGGTFGHHHGIGQMRAHAYSSSFEGFVHRALKSALDPRSILRAPLLAEAAKASPRGIANLSPAEQVD